MNLGALKNLAAGPYDRALFAGYGALVMARVARLIWESGPLAVAGHVARYEWLRRAANPNHLLSRLVAGRSGVYRESVLFLVSEMAAALAQLTMQALSEPERVVLHNPVTSEILQGMGLVPWMGDMHGIMAPLIAPDLGERCIDAAENAGIPPDTCSLSKCITGLVLLEQVPPPRVLIASTLPCDGGMSTYTMIEKKLNVPAFRLDVPYRFRDERAVPYFVSELKRLIAWLEAHTPGRMDWDRLAAVCAERNRAMELELELWDLVRNKPAPLCGESVYLAHLLFVSAFPGTARSTRVMGRLKELARKNLKNNRSAIPQERFRAVLWNPPTLSYPDLWVWAEREWKVAMLMDMMTYNHHPFIDTKSPETMLEGLARIIMEGPMSRHTRGPMENFFGDLFRVAQDFSADMIWMAEHAGCKNTRALNGIFREKGREHNIPVLFLHYDLVDGRIVSENRMREQVQAFMESVMVPRELGRAAV